MCVHVCVSVLGKPQKPVTLRFLMDNTPTAGHGNLVGSKHKAPNAADGSCGCTVRSSRPQSITQGWGTAAGVPAPPDLALPLLWVLSLGEARR